MIARPPFRFTVEQYDEMIDAGILDENVRVELIRGEIVPKMPIGDNHSACVKRLNLFLGRAAGPRAIIGIQDPIRLTDSEPEPDVSVVAPRADFYADGKPGPNDIMLLIEVADSSLEFDREDKLPIYAEAGIAEYWIVNLQEEVIEVYRDPAEEVYRNQTIARRGDSLTLLALPDVTVAVRDILP